MEILSTLTDLSKVNTAAEAAADTTGIINILYNYSKRPFIYLEGFFMFGGFSGCWIEALRWFYSIVQV